MTFEDMKTEYGLQLNPAQETAVRQTEGAVLVLAVPGSGKTTVIVSRLGYLLLCERVPPEKILTMTYTRAATQDMRSRFARLFGPERSQQLEFRTINGVCAKIIRLYADRGSRRPFALLREREAAQIIREEFARLKNSRPTDANIREITAKITWCKNRMLRREEISRVELDCVDFPRLYDGYQQALLRAGRMDYDDQMVYALRILRACPDILRDCQSRWDHIQVDEAQDTSKIQHLLIRILSEKSRSLFMVGDEDQSIYGFRAAWPQALMQFEQDHSGARVLFMEENYRSFSEITERASQLISRNRARRKKNMHAARGSGGSVTHTVLPDLRYQPQYIAELAAAGGPQTAVLFRNNDSAVPLIDRLEREGIACRYRETDSLFFSHYITRDLCDYLRFAFEPWREDLFLNLYYKFGCRISKAAALKAVGLHASAPKAGILPLLRRTGLLERWSLTRVQAVQSGLEGLKGITTEKAVGRILRSLGYGDYLKSRCADESRLTVLLELAEQNQEPLRFLNRLEELEELVRQGGQEDAPLILSTIHASKGLEYDRVILIDAVEGVFPPLPDGAALSEEDRDMLEEERRLFYVAVTRARRELIVLSAEKAFGIPGMAPSRFIAELLPEEAEARQRQQTEKAAARPVPKKRTGGAAADPSSLIGRERSVGSTAAWQPGRQVCHDAFGTAVIEERSGTVLALRLEDGTKRNVELNTCLRLGILRLL